MAWTKWEQMVLWSICMTITSATSDSCIHEVALMLTIWFVRHIIWLQSARFDVCVYVEGGVHIQNGKKGWFIVIACKRSSVLLVNRVRFWAVQNLFWAGRCPKLGLNPPFTAQNCPKLPKTAQNCLKLPTD